MLRFDKITNKLYFYRRMMSSAAKVLSKYGYKQQQKERS